MGKKSGYGNVIILKHGPKYKTVYAHLSAFAKGLKVGDIVKAKQEIGKVGKTGLATAPHLHYEFRVNQQPQDPIKVKLPRYDHIKPADRVRFNALFKRYVATKL